MGSNTSFRTNFLIAEKKIHLVPPMTSSETKRPSLKGTQSIGNFKIRMSQLNINIDNLFLPKSYCLIKKLS